MRLSFLYLAAACMAASLFACRTTAGPYAETNTRYREQADSLAMIVKRTPAADLYYKNGRDWVGTTNFNLRKPNYVIIHHTAQNSCEQTLKTFTLPRTQVSAHYVICKDGTVYHMLNDYLRAWHAGASRWGTNTDINSASIGIELDNNGAEPFPEAQINSLMEVLARLKSSYTIPADHFIGHSDIAPGRKVDPNKTFPWQQLAQKGYGAWYDTTNVQVPEYFDPMLALRVIGYDTRKPEYAFGSFRLHFLPNDTSRSFTDTDKKILWSLMNRQ